MANINLNKKNREELRAKADKTKQISRPAGKTPEDLIKESRQRAKIREMEIVQELEEQNKKEQFIKDQQVGQQYDGTTNSLKAWQRNRINERKERENNSMTGRVAEKIEKSVDKAEKWEKQHLGRNKHSKFNESLVPRKNKENDERSKMEKIRHDLIQKKINEKKKLIQEMAKKRAARAAKLAARKAAQATAKVAQIAARVAAQIAVAVAEAIAAIIGALGGITVVLIIFAVIIAVIIIVIDEQCKSNFLFDAICSTIATVSGWISSIW